MLRLSKRLEMIANGVPKGSRLADIGSDHALLPVFLAEQQRISKAVAGEVNEGPFQAASKQVSAAGLSAVIDVRLGNGLEVITAGEVDVVTIAGMGGTLIADILEAGQEKLSGVSLLILQPNVGEYNVRSWLLKKDWILINEQILEEDGKIYEILTAIPSNLAKSSNAELYEPRTLTDGVEVDRELLLTMGPFLLDKPVPAWFHKWHWELDKLNMILHRLSRSAKPESRIKEQELQQELKQIKEVIACLQKDPM
ncbi:tRNA (adenine-N(1))-methyltransferase [Paenibacillus sp. S3N08]|uniref:tRNA (Adenine-N(1))-methyltransferase n=2 Tax=Paenibacillus agricola TaxID=2716264 RepID=A0ABX0J3L2_9BACL|nr:tRNA (adenine-N(1))-methyltransferase [Paenibacillus agricola]